ncbi:adenine nucleotide alpha hydrolase family protein [Anaerosporobacter faecicola]|uniref:hypothetical protein n=1 Tax=Anaerosporobacter faecicola TaxID=2718714 RepID=UPI0014392FE1|nr:hypothetical protein [Anaerosporobacter faecicola]
MEQQMTILKNVERTIITTYRKSIWRKFMEAIEEYELIQPDDSITVLLTGSIASFLLAKCMQELKRHGQIAFDLQFATLESDPMLFDVCRQFDLPVRAIKGSKEIQTRKVAYEQCFHDVIETVLLGILYEGRIHSILPKCKSKIYEGVEVIRPLYLVKEDAILRWTERNHMEHLLEKLQIRNCPEDASNQVHDKEKKQVKQLLEELCEINPNIDVNIFMSTYHMNLDMMIAYEQAGIKHHFLENYE